MSSKLAKFAFFDFTYTIVPNYFVGPFNVFICKNYLKNRYQEVLDRYQLICQKEKDHIVSYNQVVTEVSDTFCELLKGQKVETVEQWVKLFSIDFKIYSYVEPVFNYLYQQGFEISILTADCDFMIKPLLDKLPQGFKLYPSKMEVVKGAFTGKMELLHNSHFKADTVRNIEAKYDQVFTVAFGDSQGDVPMLEASDLGFFVNENKQTFIELVKDNHVIHVADPNSPTASAEIISAIETQLVFRH
jgi:phosphoserine phosphatase